VKLPLSFTPGKLERGLLLKNPLILDAAGNRVIAIGFTPGLYPATIGELNGAAALFAAAPELLGTLIDLLALYRVQFGDNETTTKAHNAIYKAVTI